MKRVVAALCVVFVCVVAAGCGGTTTATPIHVVDVFFDGVNHGDYRQTCSVWQAGRKHMAECEAYLAFMAASGGPSHYVVVPHSEHVHGSSATVKVRGSYGAILAAQLVKTAHGWLIVAVV